MTKWNLETWRKFVLLEKLPVDGVDAVHQPQPAKGVGSEGAEWSVRRTRAVPCSAVRPLWGVERQGTQTCWVSRPRGVVDATAAQLTLLRASETRYSCLTPGEKCSLTVLSEPLLAF